MPKLVIRPNGPQDIRTYLGVTQNQEIADQLGLSRAQVSRVLNSKHDAGNGFIASVIDRCGIDFTFTKVFEIGEAK